MRLVAQPAIDLSVVEACTASIRGWLIALMAWFCDVVDALPCSAWRYPLVREAYAAAKLRIARTLRRDIGYLRQIIFLRAYAAFRETFGRNQARKIPANTPHGFRAGAPRRRAFYRAVTAGAVNRMSEGPLRRRIARLRAMLDCPEALVARVLKRLHAIWRHPHRRSLVLVAAFDACVSQVRLDQAAANTS
jgi:hypothetical protein